MRISKKAEYALRALVLMAREGKSWRIEELSSRENIPVKFLEQILLALRHGGLLTSKRGVGGGYTLLRPASAIPVGEVIRILDGPVDLIACTNERPGEPCTCPDRRTCPLRAVMTSVRLEFTGILDALSIADVLKAAPGENSLAFEI